MNFKLWLEATKQYNISHVKSFAEKLGIDFDNILKKYGEKELVIGINTEFEHKSKDKKIDVVGKSPETTLKIALAHLKESPTYYKDLAKVEKKA